MEILYRFGFVRPVFFDPDPTEANRLLVTYKLCKVFNYALGNIDGEGLLHVTHEPGQSSLLKPLASSEIANTCTVPIIRGDTLLNTFLREPKPEIVKLDIQGSELAALDGFGDTLDSVVGIECEVSFQRTYESQPLVGEITSFLMSRGFGLFDLKVFGVQSTRAAIQANAFYFRREIRTKREARVESIFRTLNRISQNP